VLGWSTTCTTPNLLSFWIAHYKDVCSESFLCLDTSIIPWHKLQWPRSACHVFQLAFLDTKHRYIYTNYFWLHGSTSFWSLSFQSAAKLEPYIVSQSVMQLSFVFLPLHQVCCICWNDDETFLAGSSSILFHRLSTWRIESPPSPIQLQNSRRSIHMIRVYNINQYWPLQAELASDLNTTNLPSVYAISSMFEWWW